MVLGASGWARVVSFILQEETRPVNTDLLLVGFLTGLFRFLQR